MPMPGMNPINTLAPGQYNGMPMPGMNPINTLAPGQYNGMPMQRTAAQAYAPPMVQSHPMAMPNPTNNNFGLGFAPSIHYGQPGAQQSVQNAPPNILAPQINNNGGGFVGQPQQQPQPIPYITPNAYKSLGFGPGAITPIPLTGMSGLGQLAGLTK